MQTAEILMREAVQIIKNYKAGRLRGHEKEALARVDEKTHAVALLTGQSYDAIAQKIDMEDYDIG